MQYQAPQGFVEVEPNQLQETIDKSTVPVLVLFSRSTCSACGIFEPTIIQVRKHLGDKVHAVFVNTDKDPSIRAAFNVAGDPTTSVYAGGILAGTILGAMQLEYFWRQFDPIAKVCKDRGMPVF